MRLVFGFLIITVTSLHTAHGLYLWEQDNQYLDIGLHTRINSISMYRPDLEPLFTRRGLEYGQGTVRLLVESGLNEHINIEFNGFVDISGASSPLGEISMMGLSSSAAYQESFRSGYLSDQMINEDSLQLLLELDRFHITFNYSQVSIRIGRQPVSTGTCFYFSPNDVFQPFSADTIYRLYKPGIDAARLDYNFSSLSGLMVVAALAYGGGDKPDWSDTSLLMRLYTAAVGLEWSFMVVQMPRSFLLAGAIQGEMPGFSAMGLRAEIQVHSGALDTLFDEPQLELVVGIDYRFESSLYLKGEYFYHGAGVASEDYTAALYGGTDTGMYLGQHYIAVGAGYELHPLVNGELFLLSNIMDPSLLAAFYCSVSVSNEMDLIGGVFVPVGSQPSLEPDPAGMVPIDSQLYNFTLPSEYGAAGYTVFLELRAMF